MAERARGGLAMLLLGLVVALGGCTPFDNVMVSIFGRSMRDQSSFDPYENPLPPPENAVPFSAANFPAAPGRLNIGQPEAFGGTYPGLAPTDMTPGGSDRVNSLVNPVPADSASLARGEVLYLRFCAPCHGPSGAATDAYLLEVYPLLPAFALTTPLTVGRPDGYIYGMIDVGRGNMPSYGSRISYYDRWNIVNYVRTLQGVLPAEPAAGAGG